MVSKVYSYGRDNEFSDESIIDRRANGRTDKSSHRDAKTHLGPFCGLALSISFPENT